MKAIGADVRKPLPNLLPQEEGVWKAGRVMHSWFGFAAREPNRGGRRDVGFAMRTQPTRPSSAILSRCPVPAASAGAER